MGKSNQSDFVAWENQTNKTPWLGKIKPETMGQTGDETRDQES